MHTRFLSLLLLASTVAAQGQLIYDNGGLVTNPGAGSGGGDVSALQGNANSFGLNASVAGSFRIADDVATNGAWIVDGFEFFLYQTGTLIPSINDIRVEIYDDSPATGGLPIVGSPGITNNLFATAGYTATTTFTNIYRTTSTTFADVNRRIQSVRINLTTPLILDSQGLNAGRAYWFEIQAAGTIASGPWVAPVSYDGLADTQSGNGLQRIAAGTYQPFQDGGPAATPYPTPVQKSMPFRLYGTPTTPPGEIANIGGSSGGTTTLSVIGQPGPSGAHRVVVSGLDPNALPLLVYGFSNPNLPFGVCAGSQRASLDLVGSATQLNLYIPMNPAIAGGEVFIQAFAIDPFGLAVPPLPCNLGLGFAFESSDAFRLRSW